MKKEEPTKLKDKEAKAEKFIDAILEAHTKINYSQLKREKFNNKKECLPNNSSSLVQTNKKTHYKKF